MRLECALIFLLLGVASGAASVPGSGSVGLGNLVNNSGCFTCGSGTLFKSPGIAVSVNVGLATNGTAAGEFYLNEAEPIGTLATPAMLQFSSDTDALAGVEVVRSADGTLIQVVSPQSFCTVNTISGYAYQIAVYKAAGKGSWTGTNYTLVNGTTNLLSTWTIENPDASPTVYNRLKITEAPVGDSARIWIYTYNSGTQIWSLTLPNSLGEERVSQIMDSTTGNRVESVQTLDSTGVVKYSKSSTYTNYSWGEAKASEILGSGGTTKTNWLFYYPTASFVVSGSKKPMKMAWRTDGTWPMTESYDTNGRPLLNYSATWTNGVINSQIYTNSAQTAVTDYNYTPVSGYGDDGSYQPDNPRCVTTSFRGTAVSRIYYVYTPGESRVIECASPGGAASDTNNLVTITKRLTSGAWNGELQSIELPDGTMTFYAYSTNANQKTVTVTTGEPNGGKTAIQNGTSTATTTGALGEMISLVMKNITGGTNGVTLSSESYSNYDSFQRPQRVTYLDGTYEDTAYGCCGINTTTDRNGVTTQYYYDVLKRVVATSRLGVVTTNILDAAGRLVATWRIGTDGSQVFLGGTGYSAAGDVTSSTNAFGGVTTVSESFNANGQRVVSTTFPDGGTRIEAYCAGGDIEKITGTAVNPVRYVYDVESTSDTETGSHTWQYAKEIKLDASGNDTSEWVKTYTDSFGRTCKTVYPDGAYSLSIYNSKGQLVKDIDPDKVTTLYQYNAQGALQYTAIDVNQNGTIDLSGLDRVTQADRDVTTIAGVDLQRTRNYVLPTENSSNTLQRSEYRISTDGLQRWGISYGLTNRQVTTANSSTGARTNTATAPDGSYTVSVYSYGRLLSTTVRNSAGSQISSRSYNYDPQGRLQNVTDARNGTITYAYTSGDAVYTTTSPIPGNGQAAQTVTNYYDTSGRVWRTSQADGTSVTNEFFQTGQLKKTYGSRTYPVEFTYDPAGRMKTMKTWQNFAGNTGTAVTTWNYDTGRGWLLSKDYANASTGAAGTNGIDYTYTSGGRLKTRSWAREYSPGSRIVTTYKYGFDDTISGNSHGDMTEISYNDGVTPKVNFGFDRLGRQGAVTNGSSVITRYFNNADQSLGDSFSGGALNGLNITNTYDSYLRRSTLSFRSGTTALGTSTYSYDTASRLASVSDGTYSANYAYQPDSSLIDTITFKTSGSTRLTTQKRFDRLNRLQSIVSIPSISSEMPAAYGYTYNDANQRVQVALADGSKWNYRYDGLGQLTAGKRYWSDGTAVAGEQFEYTFDDVGNRQSSLRGGDQGGANLRETDYARNYLNQYDSRTNIVGRYADVLGLATYSPSTPANVIVNGQTAYRKGEYWRTELALGTGGALWQGITASIGSTTNTGNVFVAPTPESYTYDVDGNLVADGRWIYTWDAENRLVGMDSLSGNPSGSKRKLTFEYDSFGHRIGKNVYIWNGTNYPSSPNTTLRFLYDGWNLVAELDTNNAVVRSYQWGSGISGSVSPAGGTGGLLSLKPSGSAAQFVAYDGNGNISALVDGNSGAVSANYEYGPFGELLRCSGPQSGNPLRYSSKYQDLESELVYFGYRIYNQTTGRWLSRDPIQEGGGVGMYCLVNNEPISTWDSFGLEGARNAAVSALSKLASEMDHNVYASESGFEAQVRALKRMPSLVTFISYDDSLGKTTAKYVIWPGWTNLKIKHDYDPSDVLHESVHTWNDKILKFDKNLDDERDEAMGYLSEGMLRFHRSAQLVFDAIGNCDRASLAKSWSRHWGYFYGAKQWSSISWDDEKYNRELMDSDFASYKALYGVSVSCAELAKLINAKLTAKGCCFRVTCGASSSDRYLGFSYSLSAIFK